MNVCPITYTPCGEKRYNEAGLKLLGEGLKKLHDLEYTAEEMRKKLSYVQQKCLFRESSQN